MTLLFTISIFACTALAFCQLNYPLCRQRAIATQETPADFNVWYQTQLAELTTQWHNKEISPDLYQQNVVALQREFLLSQSPSTPASSWRALPRYSWALMALLCVAVSLAFYWQQGSASLLLKHYQTVTTNQQAQQFLKKIGGVPQLKTALQQRLQQNPTDAHGWYLLGRLYLHDNQEHEAIDAFTRANRLQANNPDIELSLAEALYLQHQPKSSQQAKDLLQQLLQRDPNNPGALNLLALLAYQEHHYQRAIDLWQALWNQVPAGSDTALALQKAIEQAKQALQDSPTQKSSAG